MNKLYHLNNVVKASMENQRLAREKMQFFNVRVSKVMN